MRRPWISVVIDPVNHTAFVGGWRAKELVEACGGRPLWSRRRRSWSTSEATAIDVLALAERDGLAVRYERVSGGVR